MIAALIPIAICVVALAVMLPSTLRDAAQQKRDNPTTEELNALLGEETEHHAAPEDQPDFAQFAKLWVQDQLMMTRGDQS